MDIIWKFRTQNNESWKITMNIHTDSIGKRAISHMQCLFTSNIKTLAWFHNYHNAEVYCKHHRIIEFITYIASLLNSPNCSCTISTTKQHIVNCFQHRFKRPHFSGLAFIYKRRLFVCVCISSTNKHFICLYASKFPVESSGSKVQFKELKKRMQRAGWQANNYTLNQTLELTQINTQTHIHIHLLHVLNA